MLCLFHEKYLYILNKIMQIYKFLQIITAIKIYFKMRIIFCFRWGFWIMKYRSSDSIMVFHGMWFSKIVLNLVFDQKFAKC